jgi:hypothetical protein
MSRCNGTDKQQIRRTDRQTVGGSSKGLRNRYNQTSKQR